MSCHELLRLFTSLGHELKTMSHFTKSTRSKLPLCLSPRKATIIMDCSLDAVWGMLLVTGGSSCVTGGCQLATSLHSAGPGHRGHGLAITTL